MTRHQHWIATQAVHAKLNQFEAMLKDTNVRYEERAQVQRIDLNNQVQELNEKIETQGNELKATLAMQGQETREMKTALDNILHTLNRQEDRRHHSRSSRSHSSRSRAPTSSHHDSNQDPRHHNVDAQAPLTNDTTSRPTSPPSGPMTRARAKAIHDKVNSLLTTLDLDTPLDGMLPHAETLCVIRYVEHQDPGEDETPWSREGEEQRNLEMNMKPKPTSPEERQGREGRWPVQTRPDRPAQNPVNRPQEQIVEFQQYSNMVELVHQASKAERQVNEDIKYSKSKQYFASKLATSTPTTSVKPTASSTPSKQPSIQSRMKQTVSSTASSKASTGPSNVTCFKCGTQGHKSFECKNTKVMITMENGDIETLSEGEYEALVQAAVANEEDYDEESGEDPLLCTHDPSPSLVVTRVLTTQPQAMEDQRCNIFQTRAGIGGKSIKVIIDGGSCHNLASTELCEKLNLTLRKHPHPYHVQWLSDKGNVKIQHTVTVNFKIGPYEDTVECDVVPMTVCHMLLGRPWQFDKKAIHDGFSNAYTFKVKDKKFELRPMTPSQIIADNAKALARAQHHIHHSELRGEGATHQKESERHHPHMSERKSVLLTTKSEWREVKDNPSTTIHYVLICKGLSSETNDLTNIPSSLLSLLKEFQDVFPDELPHGLPPLRGIEHRIDLIPGAPLPNRAAYRTNPEDTKEIQRQIQDLLAKGEVVRLHGIPASIVSDRDVKFMSYLWKSLMAKFGVKLLFSSSSHPQTDGQTEVVNRSLSTLLRTLVKKNLKSWEDCLPHAEFAYNRAKHSTTLRSPFMIVYGFEPPTALDILPLPLHQRTNMDFDERTTAMKKLHEETRATIQDHVLRQANRLNAKKKERVFEEGDLVWVHLRKERFPQERNSKLKPRGDGPFKVLKRINNNAYVIDIPTSKYLVSNTFNISDLSPHHGDEEEQESRTTLSQGGEMM
ncbi:hypothetical protein QYE76_027102 [Lolium multiflorum]|uniref:Uncharacterized protein n=1 Tax=Lolium multiflorum TaxID=4521 RepID=A0AAD8VBY4_LOLMU|nr:hypothetical protein QYE76_027102 [Lolium multiflorum]